MKVLDVNKFQQGIEGNINRLTRLENEMKQIETTIQGLIQLEESLKGQGGEAIRGFYENCHIPFLEFFQTFKSNFTTILQAMDSALTSLEPDSTGYIRQESLEGEIEQGLDVASQVTEDLTNETNQIMSTVSDIVSLPNLDDSNVQIGVLEAKSHRDQTVEQLNVFDFTQTMALTAIQNDLLLMQTWITNIESMMMEGLTDVNFPAEQWKSFASQNPLMTTLAVRTLSLDNVLNMNPLLAPSFVSGANPYTLASLQLNTQNPLYNFGISGATTSTNFIAFMEKQRAEIAKELSCPAPDVNEVKEEENPFFAFLEDVGNGAVALGQGAADVVVKSSNSFKEIGEDIWAGFEYRGDKKFNSIYDFGNYLTFGTFDGVKSAYQGMEERADVALESPYHFANWITMGSVDLVNGAINPEESFSKEHWLNIIGLGTIATGGGNLVVGNVSKQVVKNGSTKQPSSIDEVVNKSDVGKKDSTGNSKKNIQDVTKNMAEWLDNGKNLAKGVWADAGNGLNNLTGPKLATEMNQNGTINPYIYFESNKDVGNTQKKTMTKILMAIRK